MTMTASTCCYNDDKLWSIIDRGSASQDDHIKQCTVCSERATTLEASLGQIKQTLTKVPRPMPEKIGRYTIKRMIGEGGMGIVYEAEQPKPKRSVAIKIIRGGEHSDEYHIRLFHREAQALAHLRHPGVAAVYDAGVTDDGQHYIVMELLLGESLMAYIERTKPDIRRKLNLFLKVCEPIRYAHQRGVIHRDLKPSNIVIDEDGQPKVLDFGLARLNDPESPFVTTMIDRGRIMGTLAYMSPQEASGSAHEVNTQTDVYSLGVILYELLTGRTPFSISKLGLHEAVRVICEETPRKPSQCDRTIDGDLDTIALKAIDKQLFRRYASVEALMDDIRRYLKNEPILARPPSIGYQVVKFIHRHRSACLLALILAVFVLGAAKIFNQMQAESEETLRMGIHMQTLNGIAEILNTAATERKQGRLQASIVSYRHVIKELDGLEIKAINWRIRALLGYSEALMDLPDCVSCQEAAERLDEAYAMMDSELTPYHYLRLEVLEAMERLHGPTRLASTRLPTIRADLSVVRQSIRENRGGHDSSVPVEFNPLVEAELLLTNMLGEEEAYNRPDLMKDTLTFFKDIFVRAGDSARIVKVEDALEKVKDNNNRAVRSTVAPGS